MMNMRGNKEKECFCKVFGSGAVEKSQPWAMDQVCVETHPLDCT